MLIIGPKYTDPEKAVMKAQLLEKLTKSSVMKFPENGVFVIDPEEEPHRDEEFEALFKETEGEILQTLENEKGEEI